MRIQSRPLLFLALAWFLFPWPGHAAGGPAYVAVPLVPVGDPNHAAIRVTIDGRPTILVVDTGAPFTLLDRRLYKGLISSSTARPPNTLPAGFPATTKINSDVTVQIGQIANMEAGPMHFGNGPVMVADMSDSFADYNEKHPGSPMGGLLGEDILTRYSAILDWRKREMYLNVVPAQRQHLGKALLAAGWTAVPMGRMSGHDFAVNATIDQRPFQLVVDTGASFTMLDSNLYRSPDVIYSHGLVPMGMLGAETPAWPERVKNWSIGNLPLPPSVIGGSRLPEWLLHESGPGNGPILGLLGAELLARNSAIIDIGGSTLYLKAGPSR